MEYTADLKMDLKEVKIIRALLEVEINNNKLQIDSLNVLEYNELLKKIIEKNTTWRDKYFRGFIGITS